MSANFLSKSANLSSLGLGQIGRWRALNDFLIAPLNGAIAFIKVIDIAELIAQDLHFHMACPLDHPLQITFSVAKSRLGFAPAFQNLLFQLLSITDGPHAASTTAPAGL